LHFSAKHGENVINHIY